MCGGTGFSGDASDYLTRPRKPYSPRVSCSREYAREAAVLALQTFMNRDKSVDMSCQIIPFEISRGKKMSVSLPSVNSNQQQTSFDISLIMEKVLLAGDLSKMEPMDRIKYYLKTCESLGMNPLTKPFDLITLNGKMVLYPNRSGTDQLRDIRNVDTQIVDKGFDKDTGCYVVTARAKLPSGRTDEDMGIVYCAGLKGDALANAQLKAMTKAKRRVTLSIVGLGWLDETEVGTIKGAKTHKMDLNTGAVIDDTKQELLTESESLVDDAPKKVIAPKASPLDKVTLDQLKWLGVLANSKGLNGKDEIKKWIANTFDFANDFDLTKITLQEYQDICTEMSSIENPPVQEHSEISQVSENSENLEPGSDFEEFDKAPKAAVIVPKGVELPWTKHLPKEGQYVK